MTLYGLKRGQDLENRAAQPYQEFPGVPPPPPPPPGHRVLAIIPRAGLKFFCVLDLPLPKTTKLSFLCDLASAGGVLTSVKGAQVQAKANKVTLFRCLHLLRFGCIQKRFVLTPTAKLAAMMDQHP